MQTIEEYKEYTAQLEGEVKNWRDAYNASKEHVKQLMKENQRLERERVEQNAIIETCANELEELRKHELQWDLDKAKIKELEAENNRKDGVCKRWFERCMEARTENVKLKRALYKACANWAHVAVAFFSSYTTKEKWRKMENQCRIKAKEYK